MGCPQVARESLLVDRKIIAACIFTITCRTTVSSARRRHPSVAFGRNVYDESRKLRKPGRLDKICNPVTDLLQAFSRTQPHAVMPVIRQCDKNQVLWRPLGGRRLISER